MKYPSFRRAAGRIGLLVACGLLAAGSFAANLAFLEDKGEGDYDVTGSLTVKSPAALDASLVFSYQDPSKNCYLLRIHDGSARVVRVSGSQSIPLGNPAPVSLKAGQAVPFTLQRRQWRIALIWDNTVLLRAYDRTLGDGKVGTKAVGGSWDEVRIQPVGDINVQDDFVREEGAQSIWEPAVGAWEAKTLRDDEQAAREEAEKSANAFSYFGSGVPHAITLAGNWFWDCYRLEASCRPMGRGAFGVVFYYQDDKDYLLLRSNCAADPAPNGDKLQLVAVRDGKERIVAQKDGGYEPGQWYRLRVQVADDQIQCFVDDELVLQASCTAFGQGQIGLYAEGKAGVFFDDVACGQYELFRDGFGTVVPGKWALGPGFKQADGVMSHTGGKSLCVGGQNWQHYTCTADVALTGAGSAGLGFCLQNDKSYCLFRFTGGSPAKAQLVEVTDKGQNVLGEKPITRAKHRLRVSVDDGLITGTVDEATTVQALAPQANGGAIALVADGKATFDNVAVTLLMQRRGSHVTKEFTVTDKHPEMAAWASTRGAWVPPTDGKDDWWSKGDYFGETSVNFVIPAVGSKTGTARATIGGEPDSKAGLVLTADATEKSKKLALKISVGGQTLKAADVDVDGDAHIVFARESGLAVVRVNDKAVLAVQR